MTKKLKIGSYNKAHAGILLGLFAVVGASLLIFANAATGTASFSLIPNNDSHDINKNFTVSIYENSGAEPVNTIDVKLTYDATELNFVSVANTNGVFDQCFENSGGSGTVSLVCSKLGGSFTGSQKVGEVIFSPKVGSGTTPVSFASNSHIYKADGVPTDIWNTVTTGATYTLTTPDTTPPSVSITSPANGATATGSSFPIAATATDNSGTVSKVEFYVNGALKNTDTTSPYGFNWDSTSLPDAASYPVVAKAYDNAVPAQNNASSTISVKVQNNKPNLSVSSVTLTPAQPKPGETVKIDAVIVNNGTAALVAGSSVATGFSVDGVEVGAPIDTTALAIGATRTATFNWTATLGAHSILVTADKTNVVTEVNENGADNTKTKNVSVFKPGDANNDNAVNGADLSIFSFNYGKAGVFTFAQGDFNGDGTVSSADIAILSFGWGK